MKTEIFLRRYFLPKIFLTEIFCRVTKLSSEKRLCATDCTYEYMQTCKLNCIQLLCVLCTLYIMCSNLIAVSIVIFYVAVLQNRRGILGDNGYRRNCVRRTRILRIRCTGTFVTL